MTTQTDILTQKLDALTAKEKPILRYILVHGNPQRSELFAALGKDFTATDIDEATQKAVREGLLVLDSATYRYSVAPHFKDSLTAMLPGLV